MRKKNVVLKAKIYKGMVTLGFILSDLWRT